jgi:transformation/transcription domain-associated protein
MLPTDLRAKGTQAVEIRDQIESYCQGPQYAIFLNHLVPVFLKILDGNPVFISTSPEQVSTCPRLNAVPY